MSIQPDHNIMEALRAALRKAESNHRPDTPGFTELKRILRERIAELESTARDVNIK